MTVQIKTGDALSHLKKMPDESVDCVVTSPPYWGLRDYGVPGQLGMESNLGDHIMKIVEVFKEVRRVLKSEGTCWLNYGDCYATTPNGRSAAETKAAGNDDRTFRDKPFSTIGPISEGGTMLKPKDLCMMPNRVAIALQDDGWWVRSEIIWAKSNPMPESVKDRPACAHEKIWLLTKGKRYYYSEIGQQFGYKNVWDLPARSGDKNHSATFPIEIPIRCICLGCPEGGTVLDPFAGTGTTGFIANKMKCDAILIELNPEYAAIAHDRICDDAPLLTEVIHDQK